MDDAFSEADLVVIVRRIMRWRRPKLLEQIRVKPIDSTPDEGIDEQESFGAKIAIEMAAV